MSNNLLSAPRLRRRSSCSFDCNDVPSLSQWLEAHGYTIHPTRTSIEYARLIKGRSLVILYHSGSVLCQGGTPEFTLELLAPLVVPDESRRGWQ